MTHIEILDRLHKIRDAASAQYMHPASFPANSALDCLQRKSPAQLVSLPKMTASILKDIETYQATKDDDMPDMTWLKAAIS